MINKKTEHKFGFFLLIRAQCEAAEAATGADASTVVEAATGADASTGVEAATGADASTGVEAAAGAEASDAGADALGSFLVSPQAVKNKVIRAATANKDFFMIMYLNLYQKVLL